MPVLDRSRLLMASRPLLRAGGFAAVATPVSLAGHVAAGAPAPDHATVLLGVSLTVLAHRALLGRRERSWPVITLALASTQLGLHLLLSGDAGTHVHALRPASSGSGLPPVAMLAAHALAALVLGWFLRQGEQALWSAGGRAVARAVTVATGRLLAVTAPPPVIDTGHRACRTGVLPERSVQATRRRILCGGGPAWRGPPAMVAPSA